MERKPRMDTGGETKGGETKGGEVNSSGTAAPRLHLRLFQMLNN